jgi:two-component system sensor histidine kinase BaeS
VQDITHDLRTPISAIKAQLEAMRDKVLDISPERIEILSISVDEKKRILR